MSIICGALCWLRDHLAREKASLEDKIKALKLQEQDLDDESDWISGQSRRLDAERERRQLEERLRLMTVQSEEMEQLKERVKNKVC